MSGDLAAEISAIGDLDLDGLRRRWRSLSGKAVPLHLPRALLIRLIAYRLQANTLGDLDPASRRLLDGIARGLKKSGAGEPDGKGAGALPPRLELKPLLPGTHLIREHESVHHRVMVLEQGYAWNGAVFQSLSEVARAITGTRWNGPRFFGLREKSRPADARAAP